MRPLTMVAVAIFSISLQACSSEEQPCTCDTAATAEPPRMWLCADLDSAWAGESKVPTPDLAYHDQDWTVSGEVIAVGEPIQSSRCQRPTGLPSGSGLVRLKLRDAKGREGLIVYTSPLESKVPAIGSTVDVTMYSQGNWSGEQMTTVRGDGELIAYEQLVWGKSWWNQSIDELTILRGETACRGCDDCGSWDSLAVIVKMKNGDTASLNPGTHREVSGYLVYTGGIQETVESDGKCMDWAPDGLQVSAFARAD